MSESARRRPWITRTVVGIALATCLSDFSHEMVTAILPLYLAQDGLGPAALGVIEGIADFLVSLSKLAGGYAGHHLKQKKPLASLAYLVTAGATSAIGLVTTVPMLLGMRSIAWIARGFRGPLRDYMLSDAVEKTHYGRVFGLERAADMVGAIAGPLTATLLVYLGIQLKSIILVALIPGVLAASSMYFLAKEKVPDTGSSAQATAHADKPRFPRAYWLFLVGVLLFGLGDFSRTFLILIAAGGLKENGALASGTLSIAVLLYAMHNLVSALTAYPVGHLGDKMSKRRILVVGYGLGVLTNLLLALAGGSLPMIIAAIALSGVYIAIEETLEKATVASLLPRELKSLGFGILACANAVGDMASSLYVGTLMSVGRSTLAFGIAAGLGSLGVLWMLAIAFQASRGPKAASQT